MEDGTFVAKGSKGKGKVPALRSGGGAAKWKGKDKDGGKDGGKDRGKGPAMSASRRAELFGDDSPDRRSRSRPKRSRSRRSRSRRRRSPKVLFRQLPGEMGCGVDGVGTMNGFAVE
eukprot:symbB.v1.2.001272.t1/scaffold64.1/size360880/4